MELETIVVKKEDGIATIVLNRPERLNAINGRLMMDLMKAINHVGRDEKVRAVVLTGAGRAFMPHAHERPFFNAAHCHGHGYRNRRSTSRTGPYHARGGP